jgi:hypothetical protein
LAETLEALPQPEIRRVALRYLEVVGTTLRPSTVLMRADSLIVFGEYLDPVREVLTDRRAGWL